ncbi:MAG: RluA family pseudouridine synthase [Gaiellales bacterium]
MIEVEVDAEQAGARLDRVVHEAVPGISRSEAQRLVDDGHVTVDGEPRSRSTRVQRGQRVAIDRPEPAPVPTEVVEALEPEIRYEDLWLVVVDKPIGLVTHAAPGSSGAALADVLAARGLAGGGDAERPGIVHRLDKETSGLLVVARDAETLAALQRLLRKREIEREYVALVHGRPPSIAGRIEAPIGRDPQHRTRRAVDGIGARPAVTHFELLETFPEHTLEAVRLETGRTHQIRVHFAAIGHPVVGDPVYGPTSGDTLGLRHQALHAHRLAFDHPVTGARIDVTSPLPDEFQHALDGLRALRGTTD